MTRARTTSPERRRQRERLRMLGVVALAAVAGLIAAHFGTRRAWETTPASSPTTTSVPFVDPTRIP